MERAGCHHAHIGLVHVVLLNLLQDLAIDCQRPIRLFVSGLAKDMTQSGVAENDYRKAENSDFGEAIHKFPMRSTRGNYSTSRLWAPAEFLRKASRGAW